MKTMLSVKAVAGFMFGALALTLMPSSFGVAQAANDNYKEFYGVRLTGASEVPAVTTDANARMLLKIREDEQVIRYQLHIHDAENVTDAHLHCGVVGQNGPAVVDLYTPQAPTTLDGDELVGRITSDDVMEHLTDCDPGIRTVAHLAQAMREGKIYVNVHTTEYPNGEIRGQVMQLHSDMPTPPVDESDDGGDDTGDEVDQPGPNGAHILLSSYFLLPPDDFRVYGHRFEAGEVVRVTALGHTYDVTADQNGSFVVSNISVPLTEADSSFTITATGLSSGMIESATLKVGTYYPIVTPSAWFVDGGDTMSLRGAHFGPNEYVQITIDGVAMATVQADAYGGLFYRFDAPSEDGIYTFGFEGMASGADYDLRLRVR